MSNSPELSRFAMRLLQQDEPPTEAEYKKYRLNLDSALAAAQRREKLAGHVVWTSFAAIVVLMFVGGTGIVGSFDPWSRDASVASMALAVVYVLAGIVFVISLASYYSQFRPRVREIQQQLRDASIFALQCELTALKKQIALLSRHDEPK